MTGNSKGLLPSEDEITRIIVQTMQENPTQLPVILFRIELAHFTARYFNKLSAEYNASAEKMVNKFQAEVDEFTKKMVGIIENKCDK